MPIAQRTLRILARLVAMWSLLASHAAQAQTPAAPCATGDTACAAAAMLRHPIRQLDAWAAARKLPADQRIGPAPPGLVEYLALDNIVNGLAQRPHAAVPDAAFLAEVRSAIRGLPAQVWRLFEDRLLGVYFVDGLGSTGYTDAVVDRNGKQAAAGYIVLDAALLHAKTANVWASWKENTPFKPRAGYGLTARIEDAKDDNRTQAIQYILLHELGHVLSIGANVHPPWTLQPRQVDKPQGYRFFKLSWNIDRAANRFVSVFDADFPQRAQVVYYSGALLPASEMAATYANLRKTNFPSLYAAVRPGDDFAEAFASYVHVVLMKRPWEISITRDGAVVQVFKACWEEARCARKRAIIEQLLKAPA